MLPLADGLFGLVVVEADVVRLMLVWLAWLETSSAVVQEGSDEVMVSAYVHQY